MMAAWTLALCLLAFVAVGSVYGEDDVLVATAENFDEIVKNNKKLVMEFYAPWCGHCQMLEPEYAKAAATLKSKGIVLAKMDATQEENQKITPKFNVRGFPTLKLFRGDQDKPEEYEGPRDHGGIVRYLKKTFGAASEVLMSAEEAADLAAADVAVFGVFPQLEGPAFETFTAVAEDNRKILDFGHTADSGLVSQCADVEGKCEGATVLAVRYFDEPVLKYSGDLANKTALQAFLDKAQEPRVVELSPRKIMNKAFQAAWNSNTPNLVAFATESVSEWKDALAEMADKAGQLTQFVRSAPVPEEPYEDDVKVLVASTLEEEVVRSGKDVFIMFYAPWCGICKGMFPYWAELGSKLRDQANLVIAKFDATVNDVTMKDFNVPGYPTFWLWDAQAAEAKAYVGDGTIKSLMEFLEKNAPQLGYVEELCDITEGEEEDKKEEEDEKKDEL